MKVIVLRAIKPRKLRALVTSNIYKVIKVQGGGKIDAYIFELKNTF